MDIIYSNLFTGVHGNYLRGSIAAAGLEPDKLEVSDPSRMDFSSGRKKAWKDIWGAGQGVGAIHGVESAGALIARLQWEYEEAAQGMWGARTLVRAA